MIEANVIVTERRTRTIKLFSYCVATFAEKHIELGVIFLSLRVFASLRIAILVGLVFQATKFVTALTRIPFTPSVGYLGAIAGSLLLYYGGQHIILFLLGTVLCAISVLYTRVWAKQQLGNVEKPKNIVRAVGLILAPFFFPLAAGAMALAAVLLLMVVPRKSLQTPLKMQFKLIGSVQANHLAMFAHHAHYFAYSYAVPYVIVYVLGTPSVWQGLMFYLGWVGYDVYDFVSLRATWRKFLFGHILAGLSIVALFNVTSSLSVAIFWTLTGVGGGTVAMLSRLRSAHDPSPSENLDVAEHYGHLVGTLLLLLLAEAARLEVIGFIAGGLSIITPLAAIAWRKYVRDNASIPHPLDGARQDSMIL